MFYTLRATRLTAKYDDFILSPVYSLLLRHQFAFIWEFRQGGGILVMIAKKAPPYLNFGSFIQISANT